MKPIKLVKINSEKIINPETGRQVLIRGKIGQELTKGQEGKDYIFIGKESQKDSKKDSKKDSQKEPKGKLDKIETKEIKGPKEKLIECLIKEKRKQELTKESKESKKCSVSVLSVNTKTLPTSIFNGISIEGDGACQLRSIAYNILKYKSQSTSNSEQKKISEVFYRQIKYIVTEILPKLTVKQIRDNWGFEHFDDDLTTKENLDQYIEDLHSESNINSLSDYIKKFKYGIYTTNLELLILLNKNEMMKQFWRSTFGIEMPVVVIYIKSDKNFMEIASYNIENIESSIIIRMYYKSAIHYETLFVKEECRVLNDTLKQIIINRYYSMFGKNKKKNNK